MNFSPVFVFRTPFYEPRYQEFYNITHLKEFLTEFNFMAPHAVSNLSTGLPEFQLGTKLEFILALQFDSGSQTANFEHFPALT